MKNFTLIFISIAILLTAAACKKEVKTKSCKLAARANVADSMAITYDAEGRVAVFQIIGNTNATFTFTYSGLTAQCIQSTPINPNFDSYSLFLNGNGTVSSLSNTRDFSGTMYKYTYNFFYNSDNSIIRCEQSFDNLSGTTNESYAYDSMVYENGNLIRQYYYYSTAPSGPYTLQEYFTTTYTDKPNTIGYHAFSFVEEPTSILSGFYPFFHLFGKGIAHLPLETNIYDNAGVLSYRMNYSYLYGDDGNAVEENVTRSIAFPNTVNHRFYYSCQ